MQINMPRGNRTTRSFVVLARAGDHKDFARPRAPGGGEGNVFFPLRYRAVIARRSRRNSPAGAAQTTSPPFSPECGPSSTI